MKFTIMFASLRVSKHQAANVEEKDVDFQGRRSSETFRLVCISRCKTPMHKVVGDWSIKAIRDRDSYQV